MILYTSEIFNVGQVGPKARNLQLLQQAGYTVPSFVVVPVLSVTAVACDLSVTNSALQKISAEIHQFFGDTLVAVRSAVLREDTKKASHAGQFTTQLAVEPDSVSQAILAVLLDAQKKVSLVSEVSLIVQEYIECDFAGVVFSRDPSGGMETVIEYTNGVGTEVVGGGEVKQLKLLSTTNIPPTDINVEQLFQTALAIESFFTFPQDIEWAIQGKELFVLQSRPVTTITKQQWQGIQYVRQWTCVRDVYTYEQTDLSETFHQPTPLAFSMLQQLYGSNGPLAQVYTNQGIAYQDTGFLQQIGNDVYVEQQLEIESLFPSLAYASLQQLFTSANPLRSIIRTYRNKYNFARLHIAKPELVRKKLLHHLQVDLPNTHSFEQRWQLLLATYQDIFLINIQTQKAVAIVEKTAPGYIHQLRPTDNFDLHLIDTSQWLGNTISIDDTSNFYQPPRPNSGSRQHLLVKYLQTVSAWKRPTIEQYILQAEAYLELREISRMVSVRLASYVRVAVETLRTQPFPEQIELTYFATIDELLTDTIMVDTLRQRQIKYDACQKLVLPTRIASTAQSVQQTKNLGLAPGEAQGQLVHEIDTKNISGPTILYVSKLTPDLTKHFKVIDGIVTTQGGLLSHLAIVAREMGLPVVRSQQKLSAGSTVVINGTTGKITIV